jgi:crotonyl-CoA carboxylase/reductase
MAVETLKQLYDLGEAPPLGVVPPQMHAQLIRQSRFGQPGGAFAGEVVNTPEIGPHDALVYVMAAGVNYNNVWAGLGSPVDVIGARMKGGEKEDFHIGGSDASGIIYAVGSAVTNVKVGDEVVVHCGSWDVEAPGVVAGNDPMFDPSFKIWGYETNWGSFAQFTKVQAHQCMPKAKHLTWEAAAAPTLVGATSYRMLFGWPEHAVKEGDVVLIWGGAGGLGSMAIQLAALKGAKPIAVVSNESKFAFCQKLGAVGCINRKNFSHWGRLPNWDDPAAMNGFNVGARAFGKAIWDILGERKSPRIVFEHPGQDTIPTSIFVADNGGMVVICAGTTGYNADVDLRYLWMRQKRLQGSHFANDDQATAFNNLVLAGKIDPCLSRVFRFDQTGECHQLMYENRHPDGNMAILIGAKHEGMTTVS